MVTVGFPTFKVHELVTTGGLSSLFMNLENCAYKPFATPNDISTIGFIPLFTVYASIL